jgi:hypothetical protein
MATIGKAMQNSAGPFATIGAGFWMVRTGYGLLLALVITALEFTYYFPLMSKRDELGLSSLQSLLITWGGECVLLALAVGVVESRASSGELRAWKLAITVAAGAFGGALVWNIFCDYVLRDQLGFKLFVDHVGQPVPWVGRVFYHGWLMFFFGGLAVAVHASLRRRARMLAALRAAELGRATSQQRLAEVTLGSLQSRIDPEFVFQTLSKLEVLYESDPAEADRLLQELIAFLRSALADIHSSGSLAKPDQTRERGQPLAVT